MTLIEQQIIDLIKNNQHISDELKQKYILALFLMKDDEQKEYLQIVKAFNYRCNASERGMYTLNEDEKQEIMRSLEDVKKDILKKIHSSNQN